MTCIVGLVSKGAVYLGADSAGVDGGDFSISVRADRKLLRNGDFLMGFTSSFRMGQLLAFALTPPKPREGVDLFAFMVTDFINAIRDCLKTGGYAAKEKEVEEGGTFLVAYKSRLFTIYGDYQVAESVCGYAACGCGDLIALGSLYSTPNETPHNRIAVALNAAEQFSAGVRAPFHVETLVPQ